MRREQKHLPQADRITIKKNKKTNTTKFKLRTPKYLLTLKVDDKNKAEKIMQSIPPSKYSSLILTHISAFRPQERHQELSVERNNICVLSSAVGETVAPKDAAACILGPEFECTVLFRRTRLKTRPGWHHRRGSSWCFCHCVGGRSASWSLQRRCGVFYGSL